MVQRSNGNPQSRGNTEWILTHPYKDKNQNYSKTDKRTMTVTPQRTPEEKRC